MATIPPQIRSFAFPLAFRDTGDLVDQINGRSSLDTACNAALVLQNTIPLSDLGSMVPLLAFDPADFITGYSVAYQTARGVQAGSEFIQVVGVEQTDPGEGNQMQFRVTIRDQRLTPSEYSFLLIADARGWVTTAPVS